MAKKKSFGELLKGNAPVLVDFYATWCGPCKMMPPILQELKQSMGEKVRVVQIDVDKNPAVAQRYQVQSVPTLMLFHRGQMKWRKAGVQPAFQLEQQINKILEA